MAPRRLRDIVGANLVLLRERAHDSSRAKFSRAAKINVKAVERAEKGTVGYSIDRLEAFARAAGIEVWQLVHPHLGVGEILGVEPDERELIEELRLLNANDRAKVLAMWTLAIELKRGPATPNGPAPADPSADDPGGERPTPPPGGGRGTEP